MDNLDLLGGAPIGMDKGLLSAVSGAIDRDGQPETDPKELELVKSLKEEYDAAREFDKKARRQYVIDRKYAAGVNDMNWASNANMIGAIIDILVSYLYAKDPTYQAKKARRVKLMADLSAVPPMNPAAMGLGPQLAPPPPIPAPGAVDPMMAAPPASGMPPVPPVPGAGMPPMPGAVPVKPPSQVELDSDQFAETLTLVFNRLWRDAKLKLTGRRQVRSGLSVGPGWFKALFFTEKGPDPQVQAQMRDLKTSVERLQGLQKQLQYDGFGSPEERDAKIAEIELQIQGMGPKLEKIVRQGLHIDFVPAEQMTVWLNVATTEDYLKADALSEDIYVLRSQMCARFPRLSEDDIKTAVAYSQRKTNAQDLAQVDEDADGGDGQFEKGSPSYGTSAPSNKKLNDFCKVIEVWDRRDGVIKTMVDGVKRWAVEPYPPPQVTTRYFSHFRLAFYESDGQRNPQSLSWRLHSLQDEYASCRSNQRLTRERSVPGVIFNEGQLGKDQIRKLTDSQQQEYIGLNPTDQNMRMDQLLFEKKVGQYDPRIYDTTPIVADMAKVSGVQEPQQGAANPEITATQAQIEQNGFRSRTGTDRDTLEDMFRDFATWCTEAGLQAIDEVTVQRIAGPSAFWPKGMDIQDILTLVEIDIEAGSTGKPGNDASREAWGTLLPQIKDLQLTIRQFDVTDPPLAEALRNTLRETIRRLDDTIDVDTFIPPSTNPPLIPAMPPPGEPGLNGKGTPAKASGTPPGPPMIP